MVKKELIEKLQSIYLIYEYDRKDREFKKLISELEKELDQEMLESIDKRIYNKEIPRELLTKRTLVKHPSLRKKFVVTYKKPHLKLSQKLNGFEKFIKFITQKELEEMLDKKQMGIIELELINFSNYEFNKKGKK